MFCFLQGVVSGYAIFDPLLRRPIAEGDDASASGLKGEEGEASSSLKK